MKDRQQKFIYFLIIKFLKIKIAIFRFKFKYKINLNQLHSKIFIIFTNQGVRNEKKNEQQLILTVKLANFTI